MFTLLIAYLGGVLTILSPCVLPVVPFLFARVGRPWRSHGLPMLLGMALAFCLAASLAAIGGAAVVEWHEAGRTAALVLLAVFGLALVFPSLAERAAAPLVALANRVAVEPGSRLGPLSSFVIGASTGLLWAPCAGPILGLILTSAALGGAGVDTTLMLAAYAAGACTSLALALLLGGRLHARLRRLLPAAQGLRRAAGVVVVASVAAVATGADVQLLAKLPLDTTTRIERALVERITSDAPRDDRASEAPAPAPGLMPASFTAAAAPATHEDSVLGALSMAGEWINSPGLDAQQLRGRVVLVNFWTYSCINCLRTLPYLQAWAEKYKDAGLVVVGVHTPEFAFEKQPANVRQAVAKLGVRYPVALDNDFRVWRAFNNRAWPAFYFVDAQGQVRHVQLGEERYDAAERVIRQMLADAGRPLPAGERVAPVGEGVQAAPAPRPASSQEAYLGFERAGGFASRGGVALDRVQAYALPASLRVDQWALGGDWLVASDRVQLANAGGRIAYRFDARDLHLVLGPGADGKPVRFRVRIDGHTPQGDHGFDVDAQGVGTIDSHRLFQLLRRQDYRRDALFEIEFLDGGAQAYAFTFG